MSDVEFIKGLNFKPPRDKAPGYVKASGSIKREELIYWLQSREGEWVNFDVKESKGGKWYAAVDTWKPENKSEKPKASSNAGGPVRRATRTAPNPARDDFEDDSIPFATDRGAW